MHIREYEAKDATHLFNINKACFGFPEPNLSMLENIHKGQTWVCCQDGDKPIGFLISIYQNGPHVYNIAVDPDFRKMGVATALFEEFHNFFREQDVTHLRVHFNNPAQKLYFDLGYRVSYIEKDYYGIEQDALFMVRLKRDIVNPK